MREKINMNFSLVQLIDLPDEILILIFKNLKNVDVLYSLMDVNTRLNEIIYDPIFTSEITLMKSFDQASVQHDLLLDRFCSQIIPKIHHNIKYLQLESTSMERILLAVDYPNLSQLDIFIKDKKHITHLSGKKYNFYPFNNPIIKIYVYYIVSDTFLDTSYRIQHIGNSEGQ